MDLEEQVTVNVYGFPKARRGTYSGVEPVRRNEVGGSRDEVTGKVIRNGGE